jgi:hypothetical protein
VKPFRAVLVLMVAVAMAGTGVLIARPTAARATAPDSKAVLTGAVLTNTLLGQSTQVDQVDMLSPTLGYALATRYLGHSRYRYYLVRTTNLARTWTLRSEIPSDDDRYPIFTDFGTVDSDPDDRLRQPRCRIRPRSQQCSLCDGRRWADMEARRDQ